MIFFSVIFNPRNDLTNVYEIESPVIRSAVVLHILTIDELIEAIVDAVHCFYVVVFQVDVFYFFPLQFLLLFVIVLVPLEIVQLGSEEMKMKTNNYLFNLYNRKKKYFHTNKLIQMSIHFV